MLKYAGTIVLLLSFHHFDSLLSTPVLQGMLWARSDPYIGRDLTSPFLLDFLIDKSLCLDRMEAGRVSYGTVWIGQENRCVLPLDLDRL